MPPGETLEKPALVAAATTVAEMLRTSERPLLLVGAGVRLSGCENALIELVERLRIPVPTTWPAMGIIGDEHPARRREPGPLAARGPNFRMQNSDLLLCIGARLDLVTTGYDPKDFGRRARKVVVDIDPFELAKLEGSIRMPSC